MPRRRRGHSGAGEPLHGKRATVVVPTPWREHMVDELYPHMLIEDVHLQVMPLGKRWAEREFDVSLTPPSDQFASLLADALEPGQHEGLTDAVCHFVREVAQTTMRDGRAVYEVVYMRDGDDVIRALEFAYVPPDSIERDGDEFVQRVPAEIAAQWEISTEIRVPEGSLAIFEPPISARKLRRMIEALAVVNRPELLSFVEAQMRGEQNVGYSMTEALRTQEIATAELTKDIGWDMRAAFSGKETFLEYYVVVRRLRFERFLVRFRESLIDQLNQHVRMIGEATGHRGELVVSGLPTDADVDAALRSLKLGEKDFRDILGPFRGV